MSEQKGGYKGKGKNPKISETNLIAEWDFKANSEDPRKLTTGSDKIAWWICPKCELSYDAVVHTRTRSGCPYCARKRPSHFHNLELLFPKISKRFLREKNKVQPSELMPNSKEVFWWRCENGHEYENSCSNMTRHGDDARVCSYCNGKKVWPGESAADLFPEILDEVNTSKNSKEMLFSLAPYSSKKIHWVCKMGHTSHRSVSERTSGKICGKCSNPYTKPEIRIYSELLHFFPDCLLRAQIKKIEFDIFLPSVDVAIEYDGKVWHAKRKIADIQKNIKAEEYGIELIRLRHDLEKISDADIRCGKEISKNNMNELLRTLHRLTGVPKVTTLQNYLLSTDFINDKIYRKVVAELPAPEHKNSFEARYPIKSKRWDYEKNYPVTPRMVSHGSQQKFWWLCEEKNHSFDLEPSIFSRKNVTCPICSSHRIVYENSLAGKYPKLAREWHREKNKPTEPSEIAPNSTQKYWWHCPQGHSYQAQPNHRVSMNSGCSICSGRKPEVGASFEQAYPELTKRLKTDKRNKIKWNETPLGSHSVLKHNCEICGVTIKKEVRNWIKVFEKKGNKTFTCHNCRSMVEYNGAFVSLDNLEQQFGLPKSLLIGRIGHGATVSSALSAGLGAIDPKVVYHGTTYKISEFCAKYEISDRLLREHIGHKPIDEIVKCKSA